MLTENGKQRLANRLIELNEKGYDAEDAHDLAHVFNARLNRPLDKAVVDELLGVYAKPKGKSLTFGSFSDLLEE